MNNTRYIYSAYGKEFKENMELLNNSGITDSINNLVDETYNLIKEENIDRAQLECYITSTFRFNLLTKIMSQPLNIQGE